MRLHPLDLVLVNGFLDMTGKAQGTTEKNKLDLIKLTFVLEMIPSRKVMTSQLLSPPN